MEYKQLTKAEFFALEDANKPKLTAPQKAVAKRLRDGDRIKRINIHHASGGQWEWEKAGYAGKVYKAFWNYIRLVCLTSPDPAVKYGQYSPLEFFCNE